MIRRIRRHYRIDSTGRVEPLVDVNAAAKPYTIPQAVPPRSFRPAFNRRSIAGAGIFVVGVGMLFSMPQIERAMLSAQSAAKSVDVASMPEKHIPKPSEPKRTITSKLNSVNNLG